MFRLSKNNMTSFVGVVSLLKLTTCCLAMSPGACRRSGRKHARLLGLSDGARWLQDSGSRLPRSTASLAERPRPAGESQTSSINPESSLRGHYSCSVHLYTNGAALILFESIVRSVFQCNLFRQVRTQYEKQNILTLCIYNYLAICVVSAPCSSCSVILHVLAKDWPTVFLTLNFCLMKKEDSFQPYMFLCPCVLWFRSKTSNKSKLSASLWFGFQFSMTCKLRPKNRTLVLCIDLDRWTLKENWMWYTIVIYKTVIYKIIINSSSAFSSITCWFILLGEN